MEENNQAQANGNATGANSGEGAAQEPKFTQADLDRIVKERLDKASKKAEEAQKKAAEEAAAKTLAEQGEFKTLAETRAARIAELEAATAGSGEAVTKLSEQIETYKATLASYVKAQRKNVPDHIGTLLDALDLPAQLKWLTDNADKLTTPISGVTPTPKPNGTMSDSAKEKAQKEFERTVRSM